ncbi:MAG: ATP-binding protein [Muribaculaceae bacterium]|nr:ATP-binding protein [Muribaculaceae bacterium]MDE6753725.1 ATP-binding protein [Muribaculaceae bacterium]
MNTIRRELLPLIENQIGRRKVILIMGARQVGKSTLLKEIFSGKNKVMWLNGDDPDVEKILSNITSTRLKNMLAGKDFFILDEAQRISDIGLKLKLIADNVDHIQVVATGSSSFELASKVSESLTGRKREYQMFPLTFKEMVDHSDLITEKRLLPHRLIYGYYPEVVISKGDEKEVLKELSDSYLYKDILQLDGILKSEKMTKLLQALAHQIGDQISYREIGMLIDLDPKTVEKYIDILEKSFIIFRLGSFSRNLRNELKNSKKIYFYDLGIRNTVIGDFRQPELRQDIGALWENYVVSERIKRHRYNRDFASVWFWRSTQQKEIDLIEEENGEISAFEIKWNPRKKDTKIPSQFANAYPNSSFTVITPENIEDFLL